MSDGEVTMLRALADLLAKIPPLPPAGHTYEWFALNWRQFWVDRKTPHLMKRPFGDEWPATSGVYFLFRDSVMLYVGQSMCLQARMQCHPRLKPTHYFYITVPPRWLCEVERYYIRRHRPPHNKHASECEIMHLMAQDLVVRRKTTSLRRSEDVEYA